MSPVPDSPNVVPPLDGMTEARLLRGAHRDDIPAPYQGVADVLAALTAPPTAADRAGEAAAVATFVVARHALRNGRLAPRPRRRPVVARLSTCVALTLAAASGVAASAGAVPTPLQAAAHKFLAPIGVPAPNHPETTIDGSSPGDGIAPADGTSSNSVATDPVAPDTTPGAGDSTSVPSGENGTG